MASLSGTHMNRNFFSWDHPDLTNLGSSEVESQMTRLESAFIDILGYFPTYMRPPFFSYNDQVLQTVGSLGYHVIIADIDTLDWENDSPDAISESIRLFNADLDAGSSIALAHDVHEQTVVSLTPAMIASVRERGLRGKICCHTFNRYSKINMWKMLMCE